MALRVWCNAVFSEAVLRRLAGGVGDAEVTVVAGPKVSFGAVEGAESVGEAEVLFGQPSLQAVWSGAKVKWVHLSTAGYTRFDTDEVRSEFKKRGMVLTNSSQVFDEPCAQHVLAMMLAVSRQLLVADRSQVSERGWDTFPQREKAFLLMGQSVVLLGFGAIAKRLVEMLRPFGMKIVAVRRKAEEYPGVKVIGEAELAGALEAADHVVSTLPESAATKDFMDAARFGQMKGGAWFFNVGRGGTVDQRALLAALESGRLAGAYLDVTSPEPLPKEHALWGAPNCFITPHTAGGHGNENERLVAHFLENLGRYRRGEKLRDVVIG